MRYFHAHTCPKLPSPLGQLCADSVVVAIAICSPVRNADCGDELPSSLTFLEFPLLFIKGNSKLAFLMALD